MDFTKTVPGATGFDLESSAKRIGDGVIKLLQALLKTTTSLLGPVGKFLVKFYEGLLDLFRSANIKLTEFDVSAIEAKIKEYVKNQAAALTSDVKNKAFAKLTELTFVEKINRLQKSAGIVDTGVMMENKTISIDQQKMQIIEEAQKRIREMIPKENPLKEISVSMEKGDGKKSLKDVRDELIGLVKRMSNDAYSDEFKGFEDQKNQIKDIDENTPSMKVDSTSGSPLLLELQKIAVDARESALEALRQKAGLGAAAKETSL